MRPCDDPASNGNRILATSVTQLSLLITRDSRTGLKTIFYLIFILIPIISAKSTEFKYVHFNILLR